MSIIDNMNKFEKNLSKYACKNSDAIRIGKEENDIRPPFFRDIDRIIYSLSYTRYLDKTQVFSNNENTNISKRMTHVQFVSKIARTIGRALNLNEDLIEAASLGHDLGHVPYGHVGEAILNKISLENNEGFFNHNIHSVRTLMDIENKGQGRNITVQVLDAIMCHNGEIPLGLYEPKKKNVDEFIKEYESSYKDKSVISKMRPMTLEGCVVRISDIVGYIGRDIEDALRVGVISRDKIPKHITKYLGRNNRELVNNVILDIINNSYNKPYITMSSEIYKAIVDLKKFNYENIYLKANSKEQIKNYEKMFRLLFNTYLNDLNNNNLDSPIYSVYLDYKNKNYHKNTNARIVIDFIAGMTDDYFNREYKRIRNVKNV